MPPDSPQKGGREEALASRKTWVLAGICAIVLVVAFFLSPNHLGFDRVLAGMAFDNATVQEKNGKLDLALEYYDRAIARDPEYVEAYNKRGGVRRRIGDLDGAIADFGAVARLRPDSGAGYFNRGVTFQMKRDAEAALSDFATAIRYDQANLERNERDRTGNIYGRMSRGLRMRASLRDMHQVQARLLADIGRLDQAIASLDAAITVGDDPWPTDAHFERARVRLLQGEFAEAAAEFDRFLNQSAHQTTHQAGALMYRGFIALFHANDPKTAGAALDSAVRAGVVERGVLDSLLKDDPSAWLSSTVPMRPNGYHLIAWQFFARERDGQSGREALSENTRSLTRRLGYADVFRVLGPEHVARTLAEWPGPVIAMLLGTQTPESVRAGAEVADPNERRRRACDADFYIGLFQLKTAPTEARALLQRAADNCPPGTLAGLAARLEAGRAGS